MTYRPVLLSAAFDVQAWKGERRVRSAEGARRYGKPIGSIIGRGPSVPGGGVSPPKPAKATKPKAPAAKPTPPAKPRVPGTPPTAKVTPAKATTPAKTTPAKTVPAPKKTAPAKARQVAAERGMEVSARASDADVLRAIEWDTDPSTRPSIKTGRRYPGFDESKAKSFAAKPEERTAQIVVEPGDHKTTIDVPQWGEGQQQDFEGSWVRIEEPGDPSQHYGAAYNLFLDTYERVPGSTTKWRKTAKVDAYQAKGGERIKTITPEGVEEATGTDGQGRVAEPGDWIVRQKNGEVQIITDVKFRKLYDVPDGTSSSAGAGSGSATPQDLDAVKQLAKAGGGLDASKLDAETGQRLQDLGLAEAYDATEGGKTTRMLVLSLPGKVFSSLAGGDEKTGDAMASLAKVDKDTAAALDQLEKAGLISRDGDGRIKLTDQGSSSSSTSSAATSGPVPKVQRFASAAKGAGALKAAPLKMSGRSAQRWGGFGAPPFEDEEQAERAKVAIREYREEGYQPINDMLRGRVGGQRGQDMYHDPGQLSQADLDYYRGTTEHLDLALSHSRLTQDVVTYRGLQTGEGIFGPSGAWPDDLSGFEWIDPAFGSTSTDEAQAKNFGGGVLMRMIVPKGTPALQLSGQEYESEMLLGRGYTFRVVADSGRAGDGMRYLDIEVVPPAEFRE